MGLYFWRRILLKFIRCFNICIINQYSHLNEIASWPRKRGLHASKWPHFCLQRSHKLWITPRRVWSWTPHQNKNTQSRIPPSNCLSLRCWSSALKSSVEVKCFWLFRIWKNSQEIVDFIMLMEGEINRMLSTPARAGKKGAGVLQKYQELLSKNSYSFDEGSTDTFVEFLNLTAAQPFLYKCDEFLLFIEHCISVDKCTQFLKFREHQNFPASHSG